MTQEFDTRWDEVLLSMSKKYIGWNLGKSVQLENTWVRATQNRIGIVRHGDSSEVIGSQLSKVVNHGEKENSQKLRLRNFWRWAWENWNRSGDKESKGTVRRWRRKRSVTSGKKKASVQKETDAVSVMNPKIARKNQNTAPPRLLNQPYHEVKRVSKKRSIQGKSNHGSILRQPCRFFWRVLARDRLVNIVILPSVIYKTETGCKAGDKCLFPHHKVDEQPNNKPKKGHYSLQKKDRKRRQECSGFCENCTTIGLRLARLGNIGFSKRQTILGKPDAESLERNSKATIHQVYATSCEYPGKERTIVGKTKCQSSSSAKSQRYEIWGPGPDETERQQRCSRSKAWNLAKNIYKLREKDQVTFYSRMEEWVLWAASTKEPEEREFAVDSGASMHMVSKKDLNSAELETMRTSRSPTTVMTANCEVQTREEATVLCQAIGLIRQSYASWRNSRSSFFGKTLRGSWVYTPLHQRSKTTSRQKWKKDWLQCIKLCAMRCPSFKNEFLYNAHTYFIIIFITGFRVWCQQIHRKSSTRKKWKYESGAAGNPLHHPQKLQTIIKMKDAKKYNAIYCMNCRTGCRISGRIWSMNVVLQSQGETLRLRIKTLPVLLRNCQWSREQSGTRFG